MSSLGSCSFQESQLLEEAVQKVIFPILLISSLGGSMSVQPAWSKGLENLENLSSILRATGPDPARPTFPDWVH